MASMTWDDLTISLSHLDINELIDSWGWLIGDDIKPLLVSAIGDVFFERSSGLVFWLDTGSAKVTEVAKTAQEFKLKLSKTDNVDEWFLPHLIEELRYQRKLLKAGQVYSYDHPPNLGGAYQADNLRPTNLSVHLSIHGQIGEQIRDLPDGADISIAIDET